MNYVPLALKKVLTAQRLWQELGIGWSELQQMDAREAQEIIEVLRMQDESRT